MKRPLLIMRPQPEAQETALRARAMGLAPIVEPLFESAKVEWIAPGGAFDAVMMTSANAIRFGGVRLADWYALPLYAVGAATARAARDAGFADVHAGCGTVGQLASTIARDGHRRVLYLAGRERTPHAEPAVEIVTVVVYAMNALPRPAIPSAAVALIHSKRAGDRFAEIVPARMMIDVIGISEKSVLNLGTGWRSVRWPDAPTDAAMLALAAPLCES